MQELLETKNAILVKYVQDLMANNIHLQSMLMVLEKKVASLEKEISAGKNILTTAEESDHESA